MGPEVTLGSDEDQAHIWKVALEKATHSQPAWVQNILFLQFGEFMLPSLMDELKALRDLYEVELKAPGDLRVRQRQEISISPAEGWAQISALEGLKTQAGKHISALAKAIQTKHPEAGARFMALLFTKSGQHKARPFPKELGAFHEFLQQEAAGVFAVVEDWQKREDLRLSHAVFCLTREALSTYESQKKQRGMLDYNDVIIKTLALMRSNYDSVEFFLSENCDHLLVDEAQDTSIVQWRVILEIVRCMAQDWGQKSIFVVGDTKQSIYGFQGVSLSMTDLVKERLPQYAPNLTVQSRDFCYRCTAEILNVVNQINERYEYGWIEQKSARTDTGYVGCLPLVSVQEDPERLAFTLAQVVADLLEKKYWLPSCKRAIQPQDILILTQQRDQTYQKIPEYLARFGVPCLGVDSSPAQSSAFISAMMHCANAVLFPDDSMELAAFVRTPLWGFSHTDLERCLKGRGSLWSQMQNMQEAAVRDVIDFIHVAKRWLSQGVVSFFKWVLHTKKDRVAQYFSQHEVSGFLSLCQDYEFSNDHFLVGFVSWVRDTNPLMRVSTAEGGQGVRLMTVHGSKGLEAPVVILADAHRVPTQNTVRWEVSGDSELYVSAKGDFWEPKRFVFQPKEEEHNRLMYVALTRAKDLLLLAGSEQGKLEGSWYAKVRDFVEEYEHNKEIAFVKASGTSPHKKEVYVSPRGLSLASPEEKNDGEHRQYGVFVHLAMMVAVKSNSVCATQNLIRSFPAKWVAGIEATIQRFFASEWREKLQAPNIYLERPLTVRDGEVMRVGRADYIGEFEDEIWVVDFKTTAITEGVIPQGIQKQLRQYKESLCIDTKKIVRMGVLQVLEMRMYWVS